MALLALVACGGGLPSAALATHRPGRYEGTTDQGKTFRFTVSPDGKLVEGVTVAFSYPCRGDTSRGEWFGGAGRGNFRASIRAHRTFSRVRDEVIFTVRLHGTLRGRTARGTIRFTSIGPGSGDVPESSEPCDSGPIRWTAKLRPRRPAGAG